MLAQVHSYTKHVVGPHGTKLVTVNGYMTERNAANTLRKDPTLSVTKQFPVRGTNKGISPPGNVMSPHDRRPMPGEGGLTAYIVHPGSRLDNAPVVRWRRTTLPLHGAYKIPNV